MCPCSDDASLEGGQVGDSHLTIWLFKNKKRHSELPAEGWLDTESGLLQRSCGLMMCHSALMPPLREVRWVIHIWPFGYLRIRSAILNCLRKVGSIQNLTDCKKVVIWWFAMQRWCLPWGRSGGWLTFHHLVRKKENHHSVIDSESGLV